MFKYLITFLCVYSTHLISSPELLSRYETVFSQLPSWDKNSAHIQPYGQGRTNQNYLLEVSCCQYFVRVNSPTRAALDLSFANEIELIQLAVSLDLSPPIIVASPELGIIIFPFIEGKSVDLHNREKLSEAIQMIKLLHQSKKQLSFHSTPEDFITQYLDILQKNNIALTPYQQQLINNRPNPILDELVPCHLDLCGDNFIDDGTRLWLIDWEYGGMSDPLLDIAQLTPSEYFTEAESLEVLSIYYPNVTPELILKLNQLQILSNMRIALWCLIMSKVSALDHPYQQWTEELFLEIERGLNNLNPKLSRMILVGQFCTQG